MPFINAALIDDAIGAPARNKITDSDSARLSRMIEAADVRTQQDLKTVGYTLDPADTTVDEAPLMVQQCSVGYFIQMGYARVGLPIPARLDVYTKLGAQLRKGEVIPDGLEADPEEAIGGVLFTESDETIDGSIPNQLSIDKLSSW